MSRTAKKTQRFAGGGLADMLSSGASTQDQGNAANISVNVAQPTQQDQTNPAQSTQQDQTNPAQSTSQPSLFGQQANPYATAMKKGGTVRGRKATSNIVKKASGGKVRGCGCAIKGKTKGRMV